MAEETQVVQEVQEAESSAAVQAEDTKVETKTEKNCEEAV